MNILKRFLLVCVFFLAPLGLSAQSKPNVPPPKMTDPGPPPELTPNEAQRSTTLPLPKSRPPQSPEIERELRAFVVGLSICSHEQICGPVDFLWNIPADNIYYLASETNSEAVFAETKDAEKWHSLLSNYRIPKPKDPAPKTDQLLLLSPVENRGVAVSTDNLRNSGKPVIIFLFGRGFYTRESVPDPRIPTIRGEDFFSTWEEIAMNPIDIHQLPNCNNFGRDAQQDREQCGNRQRKILELQYRLINLASVVKRYELLTAGNEKLKMPGPQLAGVEHCTNDKLQATVKMEAAVATGSSHIEAAQSMMKDPEVLSCANLLLDYNFNATMALFDAGNKFHNPTGVPLLPEEIYNFYDGFKKKEKVVDEYVRWRLWSKWYAETPNIEVYKQIWDPGKIKRK